MTYCLESDYLGSNINSSTNCVIPLFLIYKMKISNSTNLLRLFMNLNKISLFTTFTILLVHNKYLNVSYCYLINIISLKYWLYNFYLWNSDH